MASFPFPKDYGFTLLVAASTGFLITWQGHLVGSARKSANVPYPNAYASRDEADKYPLAKKFNCLQRAHSNTIENLTYVLIALMVSGLEYPKLSAAFGATWVVGRVAYTLGYASGSPNKRQYGAFGHIGDVGLLLTFTWIAIKATLASF
ncbi:hypothetical protein MNV49_001024 [Pseudohyphozyma bogoriensis]|nr:hypothetical protein MNV49_001024 [Pseudohyphozyma bogoriensis]